MFISPKHTSANCQQCRQQDACFNYLQEIKAQHLSANCSVKPINVPKYVSDLLLQIRNRCILIRYKEVVVANLVLNLISRRTYFLHLEFCFSVFFISFDITLFVIHFYGFNQQSRSREKMKKCKDSTIVWFERNNYGALVLKRWKPQRPRQLSFEHRCFVAHPIEAKFSIRDQIWLCCVVNKWEQWADS